MRDDDPPSRRTGFSRRAFVVREMQVDFQSVRRSSGTLAGGPVDAELVRHALAAVARSTEPVTAAVRASDDAAVSLLDPVLQSAEALLALAKGERGR